MAHHDTHDGHEGAAHGDLDIVGIIGYGLIGTILFFVLVVAIQAFFFRFEAAFLAERIYSQTSIELRQHRASQLEQLGAYRWVSEQEGRVAIPIERAMEIVARETGGGS